MSNEPFISVRGKNAVSGKEEAPMLIPYSNISYITVNRDMYPVIMLKTGEQITTKDTLNQISYNLYIDKFPNLIERNGIFGVDATKGHQFVRFEDEEES